MNEHATRVLRKFLNTPKPGYAVLINAPWGAGKTHFVKRETKYETDRDVLYVSLYGVDSRHAFDWTLVRAALPWTGNRWAKAVKDFASSVQVKGNSLNVNQIDMIEFARHKLPATLIFDDWERCTLDHDVLSGMLNQFVEHQGKRVILIANTDKHPDKPAFDTKKEKLIGRVIELNADVESALVGFWTLIGKGPGTKFLRDHQALIIETFREQEDLHQNLRLLRQALRDTAETLNALPDDFFDFPEPLERLARTLLALHMAFAGGFLTKEELLERGDWKLFREPKEGTEKPRLKEFVDRHQGADISSFSNATLPTDLGYALIVRGYAPKREIIDTLKGTLQFVTREDKPDWLRLWKWGEETESELVQIIKRLNQEFETSEMIEAGVVLHVYAALCFIVRF